MKKLLMCCFLFTSFHLFAQEYIPEENRVSTNAGSQINDIYISPSGWNPGSASQREAIINVEYLGTFWTPESIAAFEYAVGLWEQMLTSDVPIEVKATIMSLTPGVLGESSFQAINKDFGSSDPTYQIATWYPIALANRLNGSDLTGQHDINVYITQNDDVDFYYGTDGNCPDDKYDFVTLVLHEIGHGLGISTSCRLNGPQAFYGYWNNSQDQVFFPLIYDKFITDDQELSITDFDIGLPATTQFLQYLESNDLFWNSNSSADGAKIYAPDSYDNGSSISHLDDDQYTGTSNALFSPTLDLSEAIHDPGAIGIAMLNDIGWEASLITGIEDDLIIHSFDFDCWSAPQCQGTVYDLIGSDPKSEYNLGETGHYAWQFIDEEPLNPLSPAHVYWELRILHTQGTYIYSSGNNPSYPIFNITIDELPVGYQWKRNISRQIRAEIYLYGIDSEGYLNETFLPLVINHVPDIPDVELLLINENDCGSLRLSFYASGAKSYNIFYKSEEMPFYILQNIPYGQHSYEFIGLNEYLDYEFIVEGINEYGFSIGESIIRKKCKYHPKPYPFGDNLKIEITPNPAVSDINISTVNGETIQMFEIYKINNPMIILNGNGIYPSSEIDIGIESLPIGIYSIRVFDIDGNSTVEIFSKY